jgi:fused signal recognition particle receptor
MKLFGRKDNEAEPAAGDDKGGDKNGLMSRLRRGLSRTRQALGGRIDEIFSGRTRLDDDLLDELEEILITADLGVATTMEIIDQLRVMMSRRELTDPDRLKDFLGQALLDRLTLDRPPFLSTPDLPAVILMVGVNGVGKTTSIAKLAWGLQADGKRVLLAAADTFRAAAVEQLTIWAERAGAEIVKQPTGADPSAVAYDALEAAQARQVDVVIVDTAGRLHTQKNLMEELKKIRRVIDQKMPGAPHETLLVLDATTGQNALAQAKMFSEAVDVTGIILAKMDGTAKGGIAVAVSRELGLPLRFIGVGEQMDDLRPFDAPEFVKALF